MDIHVVRKRLSIKSWRRGTKELDLILGGFSDNNLTKFEVDELYLYERLLSNDDYLIYDWLFGKEEGPKIFGELIKKIQSHMYD